MQLPFIFALLVKIIASLVGMRLCLLWVTFQVEVFSYCNLAETFENGFQNWFDNEWLQFGVFCWKMDSFVDFISVWTKICKNCSIVILFWRHQIFSMFSLRGILVCSLEMLVLFSHRILYYRLISFRNAMQLHFLSFCEFQPLFLGSSGKNLWLLLKIK